MRHAVAGYGAAHDNSVVLMDNAVVWTPFDALEGVPILLQGRDVLDVGLSAAHKRCGIALNTPLAGANNVAPTINAVTARRYRAWGQCRLASAA